MKMYYADNCAPPAPRLVVFTSREARDGYARANPDHCATVTAKDAARLCKAWHGMGLAEAIARGVI